MGWELLSFIVLSSWSKHEKNIEKKEYQRKEQEKEPVTIYGPDDEFEIPFWLVIRRLQSHNVSTLTNTELIRWCHLQDIYKKSTGGLRTYNVNKNQNKLKRKWHEGKENRHMTEDRINNAVKNDKNCGGSRVWYEYFPVATRDVLSHALVSPESFPVESRRVLFWSAKYELCKFIWHSVELYGCCCSVGGERVCELEECFKLFF